MECIGKKIHPSRTENNCWWTESKKAKYEEDKNNPKVNKSVCSKNKRKWMNPFTQTGYIHPFAHEYFIYLKNEKPDSKEFLNQLLNLSQVAYTWKRWIFIEGNSSKIKFRLLGAGSPKRAVEARLELFDWVIGVKSSLKGCLPFLYWRLEHKNCIVITVNWKRRLERNAKY